MNKPTMPIAPWDIAEPWDYTPPEPVIAKARRLTANPDKKTPVHKLPANKRTPVCDLVGRTFMGQLNVSDLNYIAMALLETHDELCALRERVRILEAGQKR